MIIVVEGEIGQQPSGALLVDHLDFHQSWKTSEVNIFIFIDIFDFIRIQNLFSKPISEIPRAALSHRPV